MYFKYFLNIVSYTFEYKTNHLHTINSILIIHSIQTELWGKNKKVKIRSMLTMYPS